MKLFIEKFRNAIHSPSGLKITGAVLILYLFYSQIPLVKTIAEKLPYIQIGQERSLAYEKRMTVLRPLLPPRGLVGYISDTGIEHFFRSQYALAPVILVREPGPRMIVTNYSHDGLRPEQLYGKSYDVIRDFQNGVALVQLTD